MQVMFPFKSFHSSAQCCRSRYGLRHYHASQPIRSSALTCLTEDESLLRDTVARFSAEKIAPLVKKMDETCTLDPSIIKACFENGLMGIEIDQELGGAGISFFSSIIAIEELAKVDPSVSIFVDVQNTLAGTAIRQFGSKDLQAKYLPRLAQDTVGSFCLSEWGSGSDAFALKTTAVRDGEDYVLNGTKAWITNSAEAGLFVVFANADFSKGYKGITSFIVERNMPGLKIGKKEDKLGIRASSTCEVILENVRVPSENVLGEFGKGYKIAIEVLNEGRIGIGAQMLGIAEGALAKTIPYLTQRKQFGKFIHEFQGVQFSLADLSVDVESTRLLVYNAARLKDEGKPFIIEAAQAKLQSSIIASKVASACINLCGGVGFTKELGVEKYYRDAKIGEIYEGTSNICRETIAKYLIPLYQPK
ncbi:probable short/branched chain specific acyl-CoA dehydrogenase [Schistocerca gregaria]|uniref:probable short/branched chain specific acyl-CoA dehydrogenase n=1 Tax=Schistocerca gregaria TaxID=7010 RepID=UPI00211DDAD4|nr:probable short/branched chain specific acyl-CoA dehydrogenase [Schistocerca gregaria]